MALGSGGPSVNAVSLSVAHNIDRQMERQADTYGTYRVYPASLMLLTTGAKVIEL